MSKSLQLPNIQDLEPWQRNSEFQYTPFYVFNIVVMVIVILFQIISLNLVTWSIVEIQQEIGVWETYEFTLFSDENRSISWYRDQVCDDNPSMWTALEILSDSGVIYWILTLISLICAGLTLESMVYYVQGKSGQARMPGILLAVGVFVFQLIGSIYWLSQNHNSDDISYSVGPVLAVITVVFAAVASSSSVMTYSNIYIISISSDLSNSRLAWPLWASTLISLFAMIFLPFVCTWITYNKMSGSPFRFFEYNDRTNYNYSWISGDDVKIAEKLNYGGKLFLYFEILAFYWIVKTISAIFYSLITHNTYGTRLLTVLQTGLALLFHIIAIGGWFLISEAHIWGDGDVKAQIGPILEIFVSLLLMIQFIVVIFLCRQNKNTTYQSIPRIEG